MKKYRLLIVSILLYLFCFILILYTNFYYRRFNDFRIKDIIPFMSIAFVLIGVGVTLAFMPFKRLPYKSKLLKVIPLVFIVVSTLLICRSIYNILDSEFGFSDQYNQWTAKEDIKKGRIQIIEVSGLIINSDNNTSNYFIRDSIAKKYGFRYINLGCIYTRNGFHYYNKVMYEYLKKRNGDNWQKRFEKDLEVAK